MTSEYVTLGNGMKVHVPDPACRAAGYCPPMNKCKCDSATREAPVFDLLTLADLYSLHTQLFMECREEMAKIMAVNPADNRRMIAIVPVFSDVWMAASKALDTLNEQSAAVYAEITRRELELVQDA